MKRLPADPRGRQHTIAVGVVAVACAVWLLLVMPNLLLWVFARPAASFEKVGAGAAIFWVGVLAACGGILEWSFFMNSYKMRAMRGWFGYEGARWFYVGLGGVIGLMGLGLTGSATAYSLFGTVKNSRERPDFVKAVEGQPPVGPQLSERPGPVVAPLPPATSVPARKTSPFARPPAESAPAEGEPVATTPVAERPTAQEPVAAKPAPRVGDELPGKWRQLEGGFCIKFPDSIPISQDGLYEKPDGKEQAIAGQSHIGKDALMFSVRVGRSPVPEHFGASPAQMALDIRAGRIRGQDPGGEVIQLNGLLVLKSESHNSQRDAFGRGPYTLHGTTYLYGDRAVSITIMTYSQLPLDHPSQVELRRYAETFQRLPSGAPDATATADAPKPAAAWTALEGGFRIKLSPAVKITTNQIARHAADNTMHHLGGETADKVFVNVDVLYVGKWNQPNQARETAAARSERRHAGYEHVAVNINGLVMEKITTTNPESRRKKGKVEYKYLEGQHQITMQVWSELPLEHPSVQSALRDVETIEAYTP